jgi:DNA-binding response OmpR family regulator
MSGGVLIADDDPQFSEALELFLGKSGFHCARAPDVPSALRLAQQEEFDLVISDLEMPGNENMALVRNLQAIRPGLPTIMITGHPTIESATASVRLPVLAYLTKPPDLKELLELVRQGIGQYRTQRIIHESRAKLRQWLDDLDRLEKIVAETPAEEAPAHANDFLGLTLRNLFESIVEFKNALEVMSRRDELHGLMSELAALRALRETVEVLAKTKQSFKSKELGDLRRKLEGVIKDQTG